MCLCVFPSSPLDLGMWKAAGWSPQRLPSLSGRPHAAFRPFHSSSPAFERLHPSLIRLPLYRRPISPSLSPAPALFVCCWGFIARSLSVSLLTLSLSHHRADLSPLLSSPASHLSLTIFISSAPLSCSSHFHSPLLPPLPRRRLAVSLLVCHSL